MKPEFTAMAVKRENAVFNENYFLKRLLITY